jgi:hypothetical protein
MSILSISGRMGAGKDLVGEIIQYLTYVDTNTDSITFDDWQSMIHTNMGDWRIKKFAAKLKEITCIILGCTMEQLEDREFKEKELGEEWWVYKVWNDQEGNFVEGLISYNEPHLLKDWEYHKLIKLTPRKIMQLLGTDAGRHIIHPQIWVSSLMSGYTAKQKVINYEHKNKNDFSGYWVKCQTCLKGFGSDNKRAFMCKSCVDKQVNIYPNWIITDTRFPNELKAVKDRGGITIMIRRKETDHLSGDHASERALDNAEFDHIISNNGTIEDLIKKVKNILQY